jgi:hypothetical protein
MQEEYDALTLNQTWTLVPPPPGANIVSGKWVFRHKYNSDGSLARHKARWVVRGFSQQPGVDFDETFSPVVKPATIRIVLSLALSHAWPIHQLDVKIPSSMVISMKWSIVSNPLDLSILNILPMFVVFSNPSMDSNKHLVLGFNASLHLLVPSALLNPNMMPLYSSFIGVPTPPTFSYMSMI